MEDEYQTMEQGGFQELIRVSLDEQGLPCVFLKDIECVFPNTTTISSYGTRIPYTTDGFNIPKQPLRIPFFENRVLEVESDNSALQWSREATAARIAAAAATVPFINTVHTTPIPGILDLDVDINTCLDEEDGEDDVSTGSDDFFDMIESEVSSEAEQEEQDGEPFSRRIHSPINSRAVTPSTTSTVSSSPTTRTIRTVQSLTSISLAPVPEHEPLSNEVPPQSEQIVQDPAPTSPAVMHTIASAHHHAIPEEPELEVDALPPPSYEPIDSGVHQHAVPPEPTRTPARAIDHSSERHLVHDRVGIIKRISQNILAQKYEAESCPHPPLFILLPENPLRWSLENILHNKMRLHFLCDCCEHEIYTHDSGSEQGGLANKRKVHVDESKGFEIRMDQFKDQMLLIKFGHYIVNLLRMLQYGVSLDDMFVSAAFDRPVPPLMSATGTSVAGKTGMDPQLFFQLKQNVERSIAFMESLLGDEFEEEATAAVDRLDMNDFRLLNAVVKRSPYAQPGKGGSLSLEVSSSSPMNATTTDLNRELILDELDTGGTGLFKILATDGRVRWACEKYYKKHHQNLDQIFVQKLEFLQMAMDTQLRSAVFVGTSENHLNTRIIAVSKVKALFRVELTLDWNYEKYQLNTLADLLRREATSVSTVAVRLTKRVPPQAWKKSLPMQSGDDQQPISAILNLIKNRKIKHVILEGDIDLMTVPNIGTMDFSNLDILSIMRTSNRGYVYSSSGNNIAGSSGSSIHSNDNADMGGGMTPLANRVHSQDLFIPELISFMQSCSFLTELSLGFPDSIPGHIRILQACASGLSRLRRVDLFRVMGTRLNTGSSGDSGSNRGTTLNRKLELSASLSASNITRLHLAECKATGESKIRLLESLEELLTDDGAYLEDLELRFIGFNDKHAHALELGTRPVTGQQNCRLRRLVIHGNGLEHRGVTALKRVLGRATAPSGLSGLSGLSGTFSVGGGAPTSQRTRSSSIGSNSSAVIAVSAAAALSTVQDLDSLAFGIMWEEATMTHLELCSVDSLTDSDWASLLSDLNLQRLISLDLQGVWFGDRAMATLARTVNEQDQSRSSSPPRSPASEFSMHVSASLPPGPLPPPPFFSSSTPLHLQTLRLSCSALSFKGVSHMQELLSRLIHLSTISLHGFRKVTSENWIDIMARIAFRWIEVVEIVSSGYDDDCARYLAERIRTREETPETPSAGVTAAEDETQLALPPYSASITNTEASDTSSSAAVSSSTPRMSRKDSLSSRLFAASGSASRQRPKDSIKLKEPDPVVPSAPAVPRTSPSQKYLEIDLRYTDVSASGLSLLRSTVSGQAKRVIVRTRDNEEQDEGADEDGNTVMARLSAKLKDDKESGDKMRRLGKGRASTSSSSNSFPVTSGNGGSVVGPSPSSANSSATVYDGGNSIGTGSASHLQSLHQQVRSSSSTFSKLKGAFRK